MTTNALQAVLDRAVKEPKASVPDARSGSAQPRRQQPAPTAKRRADSAPAERIASRATNEKGEKFFRPARVGKRFVGAHFHPEVARQLKMLAAEDDRTIQALLEDAVDLLFVKAGKAKIANLVKKA
jgi:hypothetical protein